MTNQCLYCDNDTTDDTRHFISECCGRGMCDDCYNALQSTDEQIQIDYMDDEDYNRLIKGTKYEGATYVCFKCVEPKHKDCDLCKAGGQPFNNKTAI